MSSNKSAREELERIYGKKCMICQGIRTICPPRPQKGIFKGESIARQLTYHHLIPKNLKGQTNVNNGAILCTNCHIWLESLSKINREQINDELREYKRTHSQECEVEYVDHLEIDYTIQGFVFRSDKIKNPYNRARDKKKYEKIINEENERC